MGVLRSAIFFSAGAAAYPLLELVWRGRTHPSMALAGGLGLCALDALSTSPLPLSWKCAAGAGAITAIELAAGGVFNRRHEVWDYRNMPLNFRGQICLPYTLLWGALALPICAVLKKR